MVNETGVNRNEQKNMPQILNTESLTHLNTWTNAQVTRCHIHFQNSLQQRESNNNKHITSDTSLSIGQLSLPSLQGQ